MEQKTLIYIATTGSAVFQSQVVALLQANGKQNYFDKIVLLAGIKSEIQKLEEEKKIFGKGFEVYFYKQHPSYSFYNSLQAKEFKGLLENLVSTNTVIHIRGEALTKSVFMATKSIRNKKIKIVSDIRGAAYEEVKIYGSKKNFLQHQIKLMNLKQNLKNAFRYSNHISCVTQSLADYVKQKNTASSTPISVNHCMGGESFVFHEQIRAEYRAKMGVSEKDVLCVFLTGGNGPYQNTKYTIETFTNKGYKILNLSKEKIEHQQVINLYVNYNEVPAYLCAADIGVIWRENNTVNNVASPVKFSEYVCCGLPVIANKGVHMINAYMLSTGFGKLINSYDEISDGMISELLKLDRNLIATHARQLFSAENICKDYIRIYDELLRYD